MAKPNLNHRNAGTRWTPRENHRFLLSTANGVGMEELSEVLGRSILSIKWRRRELGVTARPRGPAVTPTERTKMTILKSQGLTAAQIGDELGRPRGTVIRNLWKLKNDMASKRKALGRTNGGTAPV